MALQKQVVDIPFGAGLSEKVDDKVLQPPAMAVVQNGRFDKAQQIVKRPGNTALTTTGLGTPHSLLTNRGTVAVVNTGGTPSAGDRPGGLVRYSDGGWNEPAAATASGEAHPITPCTVTGRNLYAAAGDVFQADIAANTSNGLLCYAWIDSGELFSLVVENDTKAVVSGPTPHTFSGITTWLLCKTASLGNYFFVFAHEVGSGLHVFRYDIAAGTWNSGALLIAAASFTVPFDVWGGASVIHIAWDNSGLALRSIDTSTSTVDSATPGDSITTVAVYEHPDDGKVYLAFAHTAGNPLTYQVRDVTYATTHVASTTVATLEGDAVYQIGLTKKGGASVDAFVAWEEGNDASHTTQVKTAVLNGTSAGAGTSVTGTRNCRLVAKPFEAASVCHVPAAYYPDQDTNQPQGWLLSRYGGGGSTNERMGIVARYMVDRIDDIAISVNSIGASPLIQTGTYGLVAPVIGGGQSTVLVGTAEFAIPGDPLSSVEIEGVTYLTGGVLWAYDGSYVQESTPHAYPEITDLTFAGAAGSLGAGVYGYAVVWEWEDSRGVLHRSAPSPTVSGTAAANETATVTIKDLEVRARDGEHMRDMRYKLYRTEVDGTVLKLAGSGAVGSLSATPAGELDISDGVADSALTTALYTTGGVLQADAWPPLLDIATGKGRLGGIDSERPRRFVFSKYLTNTVAPEHNAALERLLPEDAIACEVFGTAWIVFSETRTFAIFGDGPNDTGQQDSFSPEPEVVLNNTGCVNRYSVVRCPRGLVFQSARGIELLQSGFQLADPYIGAAVEDTLGSATIVRAVSDDTNNEVRFFLDDGTCLVWNHLFNSWASWTLFTGTQDAVLGEDNAVTHCTSTKVLVEDSGYAHDGAFIPMKLRTAWIKLAGLQGYQRIWRAYFLCEWLSAHDLKIRAGYDYLPTMTEIRDLDHIGILSGGLDADYRIRQHLPTQKCQSIRFELEDVDRGTDGASFRWSGLTLEVGIKRGGNKRPHTRAVGVGE